MTTREIGVRQAPNITTYHGFVIIPTHIVTVARVIRI
jgi:hypothetical protein